MENEEKELEVEENTEEVLDTETPIDEPKESDVNDSVDKEKEKKENKKGLVIAIVLVVLLAALGCLYFFVLKPSQENKPTSTGTDAKEVFSEYRITGNDLQAFDLYFLQLENEEKNKVYSPLSIKYALEMLSEGAKGETKKQIDAVVGDYKANKYPNNEHMSFANAMFIRDTYKEEVKEEYTKTLKDKYNAEVIIDPFASPKNINDWVSNKTFKLVNNLVSDVSNNDFFLINALAIDMNWKNQIHCMEGHKIPCKTEIYSINYLHEKLDDDSTVHYSVTEYPYSSEDNFYGRYKKDNYVKNKFNGQENIKGAYVLADINKYDIIKDLGEDKIKSIIKPEYEEWLKSEYGKNDKPYDQFIGEFIKELKENYGKNADSTDFGVYEDDNVMAFSKDLQEYEGKTLQYIGIMPKTEKLTDYIKNTDKDKINKVIKDIKEVNLENAEEGYVTRIRGVIPFFKFEYELQLMKDLEELGIKDVFNEGADLSNMVKGDAVINKAIHKANIEFSNDGIKAAAATAMGGYGAASGPHFEHLFKVPVKEIDVTFDKPYMYIIRDKDTGEVWFAGTVYEPLKK